jgi:hypothetical protein
MNLPPTRERAPSREARQAPSRRGLAAPGAATGKRRPESRVGPAVLRTGARAPVPICRRGRDGRKRQASARDLRRVPRKTAPIPKHPRGHPTAPTGACVRRRWRPPPGLPLPFATLGVLPRSWAGTRLGPARGWVKARGWAGHGSAAAMLPIGTRLPKRRTRAMAARSGARLAAGQKKDAGSNAQIASAANTVLCSRRLYIVQSGQRRKTGHVKGGND